MLHGEASGGKRLTRAVADWASDFPMGDFEAFLNQLFLKRGCLLFSGPPSDVGTPSRGVLDLLRDVNRYRALELAGPPLELDPETAVEAADRVRWACWALVDRSIPAEALAERFEVRRVPRSSEQHFSADLALRYVPGLYRRARALGPDDPLASLLAEVMRRCPLSGVLQGLDPGPPEPPDLGSHPGVWMLYAERFATHRHEAWRPADAGREYVELVLAEWDRDREPLGRAGGTHV
jgi:hypothetical protein